MKIVIKVGGALFKEGIENLVKDIKEFSSKHQIIIVHGGGPQITELGKQIGKEAKYFDTPTGMRTRYTDKDQIDNVKMALAGMVNKSIVEQLQMENVNAFGFSGLDGRVIKANRKDKIMVVSEQGKRLILRGEFSGKVSEVDPTIINFLIEQNIIPVIGSMSSSMIGEALNVDGDRAAIGVANAIKADMYISLTDVPGVYKDMETKEIIPQMTITEAENFMQKVQGGMKKKIFAAIEALKGDIKQFIIYSGQEEHPLGDILNHKKGTVIFK